MNRFLKRMVPLLLAVFIIATIGWYLFVYDRTFTRDILLYAARVSDTKGHQVLAGYFYDRAYVYSGNDEDVAIELANQYKADGNFTKAEYTLSNAIAQNPSTDLYVALSKTYVQQDKLLDAVNMLGNVADPVIRSELEMLRPKAPSGSPEAGFYNQYIPVTLSADSGTLYYNLDGEYPSTKDAPFTEEIILPGGETTIYAITVSDSGLVSPVTVMAYTIGGIIEPAEFMDPAMEAAVRALLNMEADDALYTDDLWAISEFTVPSDAVTFDDLALLPYLKKLTIEDKTIASLDYLAPLTQLETLTLKNCRFPTEDLSVLAAMSNLKSLTMTECALSTLENLAGAPSLTYLDVSRNTIRNLTPLSGIITLTDINLRNNAVIDLTPLAGLPILSTLNVGYNSISSLSPLATCSSLSWIDASYNNISTISAVDALPALSYLSLNHNKISDASLLAKCTSLVELHLAYNKLQNITMFSSLTKLEVLDFSHNEVFEVPIWPDGCPLRILDGSYNKVSSINTVWNLKELIYIYMDYNNITSLSNLKSMPKLLQINVYGNPIEDMTGLEANHIIVNYDPTVTK